MRGLLRAGMELGPGACILWNLQSLQSPEPDMLQPPAERPPSPTETLPTETLPAETREADPTLVEGEITLDVNMEIDKVHWSPADVLRVSAQHGDASHALVCVPVREEVNPDTNQAEVMWTLRGEDGTVVEPRQFAPLPDMVRIAAEQVAETVVAEHPWDDPDWERTPLLEAATAELDQFVEAVAVHGDLTDADAAPDAKQTVLPEHMARLLGTGDINPEFLEWLSTSRESLFMGPNLETLTRAFENDRVNAETETPALPEPPPYHDLPARILAYSQGEVSRDDLLDYIHAAEDHYKTADNFMEHLMAYERERDQALGLIRQV